MMLFTKSYFTFMHIKVTYLIVYVFFITIIILMKNTKVQTLGTTSISN